jgi:hypothetical protein
MPSDDITGDAREPVTPVRVRQLVAETETLAARIEQLHADLRADASEPRRRTGFRLDEAAGGIRGAGRDLEETAGDLARIAAIPAKACGIEWGVCPEHGATLTSSGGKTWCRWAGCGRSWKYDRLGMPCAEPIAWKVTDLEGFVRMMCDGHAAGARDQLVGAIVIRSTDGEDGS